MKKVLFVNGSFNEIPLIKAAHDLGYYVITSGNDSSGEGHKYSDKYVPCDYSNKELIYDLAKREMVEAICSCGNDFGALSAAYASEKLGFKGHDKYNICRFFHEKDRFKCLCDQLNLPTPKSFAFTDRALAINHLKTVKYPQIVKPSDLGGGKGMTVVENEYDGIAAIEKAFNASKIKVVLIEDYVSGEQFGFTCFIKDKKVVFNYLSRDFSDVNPFMVWTAVSLFQDEYVDLRKRIIADVEKIAQYTNMYDGMLTIQLMVSKENIYYLETMRRCLGNMHYLCLSKDFGIDIYKLFVANELGLDTSSFFKTSLCQKTTSAFMGIYSNRNGKYCRYEIDPIFDESVFYEYSILSNGDLIENCNSEKIANIFLVFNSKNKRNYFINNRKNVYKVFMDGKVNS